MNTEQRSEADLLQLWHVLWRRRFLIVGVSFIAGLLAIALTFAMPNVYRAEVLAAPTSQERGMSAAGALSGLGGLASLTNAYAQSGDRSDESIAVIQSRQFVWQYVAKKNLMPVLFSEDWNSETGDWMSPDAGRRPTEWDAYRLLTNDVLIVSTDKATGFVTIAVEWTDPVMAAEWANSLVDQLNEYMRDRAIERTRLNLQYLEEELERTQVAEIRQSIFQLIGEEQKTAMMANTQKEFAFQVLDEAAVPDRKAGPKRALSGILATLIAFVILVLIVLAREQLRGR